MSNSNEKNEIDGIKPKWIALAAISIFVIMTIFGLIASDNPDGLEKTLEELETEGIDTGIISFGDSFSSDLITMAFGMIVVFIILFGLSKGLKRLRLDN